jgi:hypothetical protein
MPDLQDQPEGPDQQFLWPLPQLIPVKALFLSVELWGDSQTADIKHLKLKQNDKNKIYSKQITKHSKKIARLRLAAIAIGIFYALYSINRILCIVFYA